jgi:hypothetical protein
MVQLRGSLAVAADLRLPMCASVHMNSRGMLGHSHKRDIRAAARQKSLSRNEFLRAPVRRLERFAETHIAAADTRRANLRGQGNAVIR